MSFDWFTLSWLMKNLNWFIVLLVISMVVLFLFPVLLGFDLKKKADKKETRKKI